jgi:hypothetical protein
MNNVTKRFFEAIEMLGETPYRIAKNVPVATNAKLSNAKNGANEIAIDVVSGVCSYYRNVNADYILTGRGKPLLTPEEQEAAESIKPDVDKVLDVIFRYVENYNQHNEIMKEMLDIYKLLKGE